MLRILVRSLLYPVVRLMYRIRAQGLDHVPAEGPALLVSNHVSFIDAILIGMVIRRPVRFLMHRGYYNLLGAGPLFNALGGIPISEQDSPKSMYQSFDAAREALRTGKLVCIFAEGSISRHGQMLRFKKGFERIVENLPAPVIPVFLDRVWGSVFSFRGGRVLFKLPSRIPYPVTVAFAAPLPPTVSAFEVRQAILELGSEAFRHRLSEKPPLAAAFVRRAKRHWFRLAMADSTGARLSYGSALVRAWLVGRALERTLGGGEALGVLLPPSVGAALANLGLSMNGWLPINLNYTISRDVALRCAELAGCRRVLTSRKFLEKLGWASDDRFLYIEDVAAAIPKSSAFPAAIALFLLPASAVERRFLKGQPARRGGIYDLSRTAAVIFTSGSTGVPKGVLLTHANLFSNIEGLDQLYSFEASDRILGVLPFFHSFGFMATLWFPLIVGLGVVYHVNPLDAKRIGDLVEEFDVTFLLATPTFLTAYLRRIELLKFRSLRFVIAGAEKLREEIADAFEKKYGIPVLEGYGATELSPVAAVSIPDVDAGGVRQKGRKAGSIGQPLPGVMMRVVDPATGETLPAGVPGLLLVKGPNVMKGYLGDPAKTAEVLRDGYYDTGDIAVIDEDGFVAITDRLSRFSKIGGEMVPHVRVEEELHEAAGLLDQTFVVAGAPDERRGERLIVLYKGEPDIEGILKKLQSSDLPKLWIPDRSAFHPVGEFPLLGSGKLDTRRLAALAKELSAEPRSRHKPQ